MHFIYANAWDKGDYYAKNQDSFGIQTVLTGSGPYGMAMICDGVGSLDKGEYASGVVVREMTEWFYGCGLPLLCKGASKIKLWRSCRRGLQAVHDQLAEIGTTQGVVMGTTFTMLILTRRRYYCFQVGDSICFKVAGKIRIVGKRQVNEHGELFGVVGAGELPDIALQTGRYSSKHRFILCSDGFGRCLSLQALKKVGDYRISCEQTQKLIYEIINRGRRKGEWDNCTVIMIGRK